MSDRLERLLDQDDERRNFRCSKCRNVDASKVTEQLIRSERRNRLLEDELRQRVRREELFLAGHPTEKALVDRVVELEGIVQRLNERISRRKSA